MALTGKLMAMPVASIILAAGASRRLGQPKQLLMLGGETMIGRAIRLVHEGGAAPVIVVLGAHCELIRETVVMADSTSVINNIWEQGIATSIQAGLDALEPNPPENSGVLILGCDQPRLTSGHMRGLLWAFRAQEESVIVASTYAGVLGTPAVFPRSVFAYLRALRGDKGARSLLMHPPCPLVALPFPGGEFDVDLPADLDLLK